MNPALLNCNELSYSIGYKKILKKVSFALGAGECVTITGDNGSGKSTLLKILCSYHSYQKEIIWNKSNPILSYLGHDLGLYSSLTLNENLNYYKGISKETISNQEIESVLKSFNLFHRVNETLHGFSKGMKQKTGLIRALIPKCDLLLLDEPFSGLDQKSSTELIKILKDKKNSSCILLVTHDKQLLSEIADRNFHIENGELKF